MLSALIEREAVHKWFAIYNKIVINIDGYHYLENRIGIFPIAKYRVTVARMTNYLARYMFYRFLTIALKY